MSSVEKAVVSVLTKQLHGPEKWASVTQSQDGKVLVLSRRTSKYLVITKENLVNPIHGATKEGVQPVLEFLVIADGKLHLGISYRRVKDSCRVELV